MDYLWRDSVHLGVPYGRNYDQRLLNALTVNEAGDGWRLPRRGSSRLRYSSLPHDVPEVYWHHTVRSLSAMMEQAWADLVSQEHLDSADLLSRLLSVGDDELLRGLVTEARPNSIAARTLHCVTGDRRKPFALNDLVPGLPRGERSSRLPGASAWMQRRQRSWSIACESA